MGQLTTFLTLMLISASYLYMIFLGVIFFPLSFPLSPGLSFCACCILFIRLELLMPSNCNGAQATATGATVKYKPKIGKISSILSEYTNFYWKTRKKDCLGKSEFYSFTWQTTGWNIISVCTQLLENSPHKCLVSCLELHLKAGLRPNSLCNSLLESYRIFLVHAEEGRTLSPSSTGAVMGIEMPVLGLSEDLSLPAISAVYQSWIAAEGEVIKQLSYSIFLLHLTSFTSHHELSTSQTLQGSKWAPHHYPFQLVFATAPQPSTAASER